MTIKWKGTLGFVALFVAIIVLPTALACGLSTTLLAAAVLGTLEIFLLFAATEQHEEFQPQFALDGAVFDETGDRHRNRLTTRTKAVVFALLGIISGAAYLILLLSLEWSGWWWIMLIADCLISATFILDLSLPILLDA